MATKTNHIIETIEEPFIEASSKVSTKRNKVITDVMGGDFLGYEKVRQQFGYVLFLAMIALIYIANSYHNENISREIDTLNRELKELHYDYISSKSQVMHEGKQSEIARKLSHTELKESTEPVRKIIVKKTSVND